MGIRRSDARRGFTLVEILVAMTISSIVILAVHGALEAGRRLWQRQENRRPIEEQAGRIIAMMRTEWAGFYMPSVEDGARPAFGRFEDPGRGEQAVWFCTTAPGYYRGLPPGRCAKVTYELRRLAAGREEGRVLVRREQWLAGEKPIAEPTAEVVASGLSEWAIEFLDAGGRTDRRADPQEGKPPRMVRLRMSWPVRDAMTGQAAPRSFCCQFLVPVTAALEQGQADRPAS